MSIIEILLREIEQEAQTTRKFLNIIPADKYDWKPHAKSMTLKQLVTHIAELPEWVSMAIKTDGLDFAASPYQQINIANNEELLAYFEKNYANGRADLEATNEEVLEQPWTLRNGDEIYFTNTKYDTVRVSISQTTHHRAQLGVYLRLLNIPIPGSYGPSADELGM
jgi:uncharacterized damage-inducible protein DinB